MIASREQGLGVDQGTAVPCCQSRHSVCFRFPLIPCTIRSNGVIHQHSLQQPGSSSPSAPPVHLLRENGKQQRFPHKGAWGGCHAPLPPEPKSSGFPVSPRAVWSLMRYWAGLLDLACFVIQHHLLQGAQWKSEAPSGFFVTLLVSLLSSSFLPHLPPSSFLPSLLHCSKSDKKGVTGRSVLKPPCCCYWEAGDEAVKPQLRSTNILPLPWWKCPGCQSTDPTVFWASRALLSPALSLPALCV